MNRSTVEPEYQEQFTLFIDLLGFKEAIEQAAPKIEQIKEFLRKLAKLCGPYELEIGGESISFRPAVSTFSDCIVCSYPFQTTVGRFRRAEGVALLSVISQIQSLISEFAADALRLGLLLRGGIALGDLYHAPPMKSDPEPHIIFGRGLIDAHALESKCAIYPRIVVSPEIIRRIDITDLELRGTGYLLKCDDGLWCINYFDKLANYAGCEARYSPTTGDKVSILLWRKHVLELARRNIRKFESGENQAAEKYAKWSWFKKQFCDAIERANRHRGETSQA